MQSKVYVVEHECDDPFYSPYLVAIFSTKEKAQEYINKQPTYEQKELEISEVEVDNATQ